MTDTFRQQLQARFGESFLARWLHRISGAAEALERLAESNERVRAILEAALDGIIMIDERGSIVSINPATERIFGWTEAELLGRSVNMLMADNLARDHDAHLARYSETGRRHIIGSRREVDGKRRDGSIFPLELSVAEVKLPRAGHRRFFIGTVRDLTEQKKLAHRLQQAQKLEAVGQLTGGIAHDCNNYLLVILGNLDAIRECLDRNQTPPAECLDLIEGAAVSGSDLFRSLTGFSRDQPLSPTLFPVEEMIRQSLPLIRFAGGETVTVTLDLAPDESHVLLDRTQMETTLLNLVINARDAMPKGGSIKISTEMLSAPEINGAPENAEIDSVQGGEVPALSPAHSPAYSYVAVSVSDNGAGIPPEFVDRVFEPFFTTKEACQGTGLGLSMVYGFIKQSGGHVDIRNNAPGTTIRLLLPRRMPS